MKKRTLLMMTFIIFMFMVPVCKVSASEIIASGGMGENASWTLNSDGVLTISGTGIIGKTEDDGYISGTPYSEYESQIKSVVVKEGITRIGEGVVSDLNFLRSVEFPDSMTMIDTCTFFENRQLQSVKLGSGLLFIRDTAFWNCSKLSEIYIPENVVSMDGAFYLCNDLQIKVSEDNLYYSSENGALFDKKKEILYYVPRNLSSYTIPDTVKTIESRAFYQNYAIEELSIPVSLKKLDSNAFFCVFDSDYPLKVFYEGSKSQWEEIKIINEEKNNYGRLSDAIIEYNVDIYGRNTVKLADTSRAILNISSQTIICGNSCQLSVENMDMSEVLSIAWSSSKNMVAAVSKKGLVTSKTAGKSTITCKITYIDKSIKELTCTVTIAKRIEATEVKINNKEVKSDNTLNMCVGDTLVLKTTIIPAKSNDSCYYSSSNSKVVSVSSTGEITAKKAGIATIEIRCGISKKDANRTGSKAIVKMTVTVEKKETPKINKTSVELLAGKTLTLKVTGTSKAVKWSSSDKKIATVSSAGIIKAKKAGVVTITANVGNSKLICEVTVKE